MSDPQSGKEIRIQNDSFQSSDQAKDYLKDLETEYGVTGPRYCCSHGQCKAEVHFSKKVERASGKRSNGRDSTWVSNDVKTHAKGCPGPQERHRIPIAHNGLSLAEAIAKKDELIVLHLNMELGHKTAQSQFDRSTKNETEDERWRKQHSDQHSCFPNRTLEELCHNLAQIVRQSGNSIKATLKRTYITHEGAIMPLSDFIVRNNGRNRLGILEGEPGRPGLYTRADWRRRYAIHSDEVPFVFGFPRLVFFEAAPAQYPKHDNPKRVNGWRYSIEGDKRQRVIHDQLNLSRTGLIADDLFPAGALILARPYIHQDQNSDRPIVHWSIESEDNINLRPRAEITKILCWNGQNIPKTKPTQLSLGI